MKLKECHNPAFDFTFWPINDKEYDFSLVYKGQPLDLTEGTYTDDSIQVEFSTPPGEYLDFDAAHYFDGLVMKFTFEPEIVGGLCSIVKLIKTDNCIVISYFLCFSLDEAVLMKYNPIRLMKSIRQKLYKKGFTTDAPNDWDEENWFMFNVYYKAPLSGILANYYKQGVTLLEELYTESLDEIKRMQD